MRAYPKVSGLSR